MLSKCYDYSIEISDPKKNSDWNLYNVDIVATAKANSNMKDVVLLIINTLKGLSIPNDQLESLINQNQDFYCIPIDNKPYFFRSFRTYISINLLCKFLIPSFSSRFIISNGIQTIDIRELHKVLIVELNKRSEGDIYTRFKEFKENNSDYIAKHLIMDFSDHGIYDFELSKNDYTSHKVNGYDWRFGLSSYSVKEFNKTMLDSYGSKEYKIHAMEYYNYYIKNNKATYVTKNYKTIEIFPYNLMNIEIKFKIVNSLKNEDLSKISKYEIKNTL